MAEIFAIHSTEDKALRFLVRHIDVLLLLQLLDAATFPDATA